MLNGLQRVVRAVGRMLLQTPARSMTSSGEVASGLDVTQGRPDLDYVQELQWPDRVEKYREMANDAQIAKELRSIRAPLINADAVIEPASDDARDVLIAEFCAANILQEEGETFGREFWCGTPWLDHLRDALRMVEQGFAAFQKLHRRQGRFVVFDKFKYILPESIDAAGWVFDETDNLLRLLRTFQGSDGTPHTREPIEADQLVIYTWDQEGSNILGRPLLRCMWGAWNRKSKYLHYESLDKQKTSIGIPFFKNPADASVEDVARGEQVTKAMRAGKLENLYVHLREGQDFGWKEGGQSTKGLPEMIDGENMELAKGGVSLFQELGLQQTGGSRGVSGTSASFSSLLLTAMAKEVASQIQRLVRENVDTNWGPVRAYPKFKFSNIDPFEKTRAIPEFVQAVTALRGIGDTDTENEVRNRYGFMEVDPDTIPEPPPKPGDNPDQGDGTDPDGEGKGNQDPGSDAATEPVTNARAPVRLEADPEDPMVRARVDAGAVRTNLERLESLYLSTLRSVRRDMAEAAIRHIADSKKQPTAAKDVRVPFQQELKERLLALAKAARDYGREAVEREVGLQMQTLARAPIPDPTTRTGAIRTSNRQAEVQVEMDVTNLVARLQSEVVGQFNQLGAAGLTQPEIARKVNDYLASLSDRQIEDMARQSTSLTFNAGRNVAIMELAEELEPEAVRVEVDPTDPNTCDPCQGLNGKRFRIGSAEYLENQPPQKCDGRLRCRGFMVVFPKAQREAA